MVSLQANKPPFPVISVLGHGTIQVRNVMGTDLTIVNAARVSFGKFHSQLEQKDEKLIHYLLKNRHFSPFRHCFVSFHVKCPIFVQRQFWKHLLGCEYSFKDTGYNEISGRYIEMKQFFEPSSFRKQSKINKQGSEGEIDSQPKALQLWRKTINQTKEAYQQLLAMGVCKEQARGLLPCSTYTEFIWSASFQAILNFIELRCERHAQYEIRKYAEEMKKIMIQLFPVSTKKWLETQV